MVLSIHSLIFQSFTRVRGRSGLCWCVELSEEAGTSPGLSSTCTAFVASSPSQGPDPLPYQVVGPTLLDPHN